MKKRNKIHLITKAKKRELILFYVYFLLIGLFTILIKPSYLPGVLLFFGMPSLYLTIRRKEIFKKTFLTSLFATFTIVFITDYVATASKSWFENSTLNIFVLKIVPWDAFIWGFLFFYFAISFYEYFLEKDKRKDKFNKNTKYLIYLLAVLSIIFGTIYSINKDLFIIKYFYSFFVLIFFIIPIISVLLKYPSLIKKTFIMGIFFSFFGLIYEISALYAGQWFFYGEYLKSINFFKLSFPLEELIFIILAVPTIILIYEYFIDDKK